MPKMPPWIVWVLVITRAHQPTIGMFSSSLLSVIAKRKGVSRHNFFTPSTTYYNMRNRSMIWSNPIERRIHDATDKEVSTSSFLWLIHTTYLCTKCNTYRYFGTQTNISKYREGSRYGHITRSVPFTNRGHSYFLNINGLGYRCTS